ncbi:MAG: peptide deformylase [Planctomycetes bacterium]|nr:peptide deformylase [Planctomycetota bacterium]
MILPDPQKLRIELYPNPVLKKACTPIDRFGDDVQRFAEGMIELMLRAKGVGLSAPQVGVPIRLFVCNPTGEPGDSRIHVNPRFTELTGAAEMDEGCLSLPGVDVAMRRATTAVMQTQGALGNKMEITATDLLARIWQHEADHLEGRLIVDNMSTTDEITNRKILKQLKADYAAARKR